MTHSGRFSPAATESIQQLLARLGLVRHDRLERFSDGTRDHPNLPVYRDRHTGVIFIDGHFVGDEVYRSGDYRGAFTSSTLESVADTTRRVESFLPFIADRTVADFGCGAGDFLRAARPYAKAVCGLELQESFISRIRQDGIPCERDLAALPEPVQTMFMFHSLEHLADPAGMLRQIRTALRPGDGTLIVEVPHARDLLLNEGMCSAFKRFTLWSQHLILHTRESLRALLDDAGFEVVLMQGVQRYGISNHLHWLAHGAPGGHKQPMAAMETPGLRQEYAQALARIDATDTLVAVARLRACG